MQVERLEPRLGEGIGVVGQHVGEPEVVGEVGRHGGTGYAPGHPSAARLSTVCAMEINGVPLHPLVIHAVVVFVPLAALAAIAMSRTEVALARALAGAPADTRRPPRPPTWPSSPVRGASRRTAGSRRCRWSQTHEQWGDRLVIAMVVFAAVVVVAFWVLPHVTRLSGGKDRVTKMAALEKPLMVLLPLTAVVALVLVFLTGDAGARAVWKD